MPDLKRIVARFLRLLDSPEDVPSAMHLATSWPGSLHGKIPKVGRVQGRRKERDEKVIRDALGLGDDVGDGRECCFAATPIGGFLLIGASRICTGSDADRMR